MTIATLKSLNDNFFDQYQMQMNKHVKCTRARRGGICKYKVRNGTRYSDKLLKKIAGRSEKVLSVLSSLQSEDI